MCLCIMVCLLLVVFGKCLNIYLVWKICLSSAITSFERFKCVREITC